ncbi:hypothetical protein BGW80DRAFT_1341146 [Lactifluus volemus]|nr:hypothetical protein BGW80DRAFT_1341146 [Lactifluus volemus]
MSDHQTCPLRPEDEGLLQAALSDPSSVSSIRRLPPSQPTESAPSTDPTASTSTPAPAAAATAAVPAVSSSSFMSASISTEEKEARKARYEAMMAESRRDRAAARASGELELARLEERRAHQRQVAAALSGGVGGGGQSPTSSASASELETVSSQRSTPTIAELSAYWLPPRGSSSGGVVDVRGGGSVHGSSVSGQALSDAFSKVSAQQQGQANNPQSNLSGSTTTSGTHQSCSVPSAAAGTEPTDSPLRVNVPSLVPSLFPSSSFPEPSRPHAPEHHHHYYMAPPPMTNPVTAASTRPAVFDDTLPVRSSSLTSLSINLFLSFMKGVMFGFGEIFAKTVIARFGWGPAVATNVGLGRGGRSRRGGKSV